MSDLIVAVGLAVTLEGALYALFPDGMKRMMAMVLQQPSSQMRIAGLVAAFVGVGIVWSIRGQ
ncbi:MAG: DUF2065 domain-containing protein [Rhodospirillales bacterium]|nr:DUF2065 domain-containing protein [Rhodospirillales bacterium]